MILQQYKIVFLRAPWAQVKQPRYVLSDIPVLLTEALNTDDCSHSKMETTVGIDYGEITLEDGTKIGLYGTPGQSRFEFIWPVICQGALGGIILIDHTVSAPIQELESYIEVFQEYTNNIAIGITRSDLESPHFTQIYKDWLIQQDLYTPPLFCRCSSKRRHLTSLKPSLLQSKSTITS